MIEKLFGWLYDAAPCQWRI